MTSTALQAGEAEQNVVGALLMDANAYDKIAGKLAPSDFVNPKARRVFEKVCEFAEAGEAHDCVAVGEAIPELMPYCIELLRDTVSAALIDEHARIVAEKADARALVHALDETKSAVLNGDRSALSKHSDAITKIAEKRQRGAGLMAMPDVMRRAFEMIDTVYHRDGQLLGVSTGFADIDSKTDGLCGGDFVVVAARPSMGKSALAVNMLDHIAKHHGPVALFSLEMAATQLAFRMIAGEVPGLTIGDVRNPKKLTETQWSLLTQAMKTLKERQFFIDQTSGLTISELCSRARTQKRKTGLAAIAVDYLQLVRVPGKDTPLAEVSEVSRRLKGLAVELDVPVIALAQLSRKLEQRPDKRPIMSDLRESGQIEQDADLIAMLYRDEYYHEGENEGVAEFIIRKQRNGNVGVVYLQNDLAHGRFRDYSGDPPQKTVTRRPRNFNSFTSRSASGA